jgi:hypothetical protein
MMLQVLQPAGGRKTRTVATTHPASSPEQQARRPVRGPPGMRNDQNRGAAASGRTDKGPLRYVRPPQRARPRLLAPLLVPVLPAPIARTQRRVRPRLHAHPVNRSQGRICGGPAALLTHPLRYNSRAPSPASPPSASSPSHPPCTPRTGRRGTLGHIITLNELASPLHPPAAPLHRCQHQQ